MSNQLAPEHAVRGRRRGLLRLRAYAPTRPASPGSAAHLAGGLPTEHHLAAGSRAPPRQAPGRPGGRARDDPARRLRRAPPGLPQLIAVTKLGAAARCPLGRAAVDDALPRRCRARRLRPPRGTGGDHSLVSADRRRRAAPGAGAPGAPRAVLLSTTAAYLGAAAHASDRPRAAARRRSVTAADPPGAAAARDGRVLHERTFAPSTRRSSSSSVATTPSRLCPTRQPAAAPPPSAHADEQRPGYGRPELGWCWTCPRRSRRRRWRRGPTPDSAPPRPRLPPYTNLFLKGPPRDPLRRGRFEAAAPCPPPRSRSSPRCRGRGAGGS